MIDQIKSYDELIALLTSPDTEKDVSKARNGNKSAILRLRKTLKHAKALCKQTADEAQLARKISE